ncbi:MAG: phosphatase PAP2 family protein [Planctomycetia bacterium]|nr:phosphatase PAP2 family protein [Planctomycetia bacterium]
MARFCESRLFATGAVLWLLAGASVFTMDGPLARLDVSNLPGDVRRLIQLTEVFAHGTGVGMILVTLWVLDRDRRSFIPRVAALAFLPGMIANLCKLLVTRHRPSDFDLDAAASTSFVGIPGSADFSQLQSFPSGHTATAVGLAIALGSVYPRGRILFASFALFAAAQRVLFDAHFLSDTLVGAGIACFVAAPLRERLFWDVQS